MGGHARRPAFAILQVNVGKSWAAQDLAAATARAKKVEVLAITEPTLQPRDGWHMDTRGDSTIKVLVGSATASGKGDGFVWVEVAGVIVYSCYFSPNRPTEEYEEFLSNITRSLRTLRRKPTIITGDFNAKSPEWGSPWADTRGDITAEWAAALDLSIVNRGTTPTFRRGESKSIIDLTWANNDAAKLIDAWHVVNEETLSLHSAILTSMSSTLPPRNNASRGWTVGKLKEEEYKDHLLQEMKNPPATPQDLVTIATRACNAAMPKRGNTTRPPVYWWNETIAQLRRTAFAARRAHQRKRKRCSEEECEAEREAAKNARRELKAEIAASKRRSWENLQNEVDEDLWGKGYRIVAKRFRAREAPVTLPAEQLRTVLVALFPQKPKICWIREEDSQAPPVFTLEELEIATRKIKNRRSPGPDMIPPEAVKIMFREHPQEVLGVYNTLLHHEEFPQKWKIAKLVLIRKPNKPLDSPASFRPLCLLDVLGKAFEHLILQRLRKEVENSGDLSENQFGFRVGRSTVDALAKVKQATLEAKRGNWRTKRISVFITFDIRNAFNTASWRIIVRELRERRVPHYLLQMVKSYLSNRRLLIDSMEGTEEEEVTCGVPQGSVLGPFLWNILYDGILRIKVPDGVQLIAFADDLAVVASAKTKEELVEIANNTIDHICEWTDDNELELAPEKTEVLFLAGQKKAGQVTFRVRDQEVTASPSVKYLGVTIGRGGTYGKHVAEAARTAANIGAALGRIMPNIGGPRASKRRMYGHVIQSVMLYAAPIWADTLDKECHRKKMAAVQRKAAIRITSAYRTTSEEAVLVLAGLPPIDLVAKTRAAKKEDGEKLTKKERDEVVRARWKERWEEGKKGAWTRRLLPALDPWLDRGHGEVNYHLTQMLTGHGCFRAYLRWIRKAPTDSCVYCQDQVDDVEHAIFECGAWKEARETMEKTTGRVTPDNIVAKMLEEEEKWRAVSDYVRIVVTAKETADREEERGARTTTR